VKILLTNDDGVNAKGISVLREIALQISDDVWTCAPETEQSATSRSVSLHPDLILSGVNRGQNLAEDITFSGTVAGALQGMQMGVPSIALSLARGFQGATSLPWETALAHGPKLISDLLAKGWDKNVALNINFPDRAPDDVAGTQFTRVGKRDFQMTGVDRRPHPRGGEYFWLTYGAKLSDPPQGTDLRAIYDGYISVTPLHTDLTHDPSLSTYNA